MAMFRVITSPPQRTHKPVRPLWCNNSLACLPLSYSVISKHCLSAPRLNLDISFPAWGKSVFTRSTIGREKKRERDERYKREHFCSLLQSISPPLSRGSYCMLWNYPISQGLTHKCWYMKGGPIVLWFLGGVLCVFAGGGGWGGFCSW